jgi:hypothetical protein
MSERLPRVKWPRTIPICGLFGIVMAVLLTGLAAMVQIRLMQPLQQLYLVPFLRSSALPFRLTVKLIEVYTPGRSWVMAVDPWVSLSRDHTLLRIEITGAGISAGITTPRLYTAGNLKPQAIRPFLEHSIYHATAIRTFLPTIIAFCFFFAAGLLAGAWFDQQHQEASRRGVQIRGPRLMPPRKAHQYLKGDGIALFLEPKAK